MSNAAPGWYPVEGDNRRRYWNGQEWTDHFEDVAASPAMPTPPPSPPGKGGMSTMTKSLIGGAAAIVLIGAVGAAIGGDSETPAGSPSKSSSPSATKDAASSPKTLSAESANALLAAQPQPKNVCAPSDAERQTFMTELTSREAEDVATIHLNGYLTTACDAVKQKAAEAKAAADAAAKAAAAKAALTNPKTYKAIDKRALAKVIKNPDAYIGHKYVVFAEVTQFDSITGGDRFRADVAHKDIREYGIWVGGENSFVDAGAADLSEVVNGDIVKMYVSVEGTESYETTMGGTLTVPVFTANILKVIGSSD